MALGVENNTGRHLIISRKTANASIECVQGALPEKVFPSDSTELFWFSPDFDIELSASPEM